MSTDIRQILQAEIDDHTKAGYEWGPKDVFAVNADIARQFVEDYDSLRAQLADCQKALVREREFNHDLAIACKGNKLNASATGEAIAREDAAVLRQENHQLRDQLAALDAYVEFLSRVEGERAGIIVSHPYMAYRAEDIEEGERLRAIIDAARPSKP